MIGYVRTHTQMWREGEREEGFGDSWRPVGYPCLHHLTTAIWMAKKAEEKDGGKKYLPLLSSPNAA